MKHYTKITSKERDLLARWKIKGYSNKECSRRLGRSCSSVGRELKRNQYRGTYYVAIHAQEKADKRSGTNQRIKMVPKNVSKITTISFFITHDTFLLNSKAATPPCHKYILLYLCLFSSRIKTLDQLDDT